MTAKYYIFQGGPELIKYWIGPEVGKYQKHRWYWSANKNVVPGDKAFIYLTAPQSRIIGEVDVLGEPFFNEQPYAFDNPHMNDKYCCEVGNPIVFGNTYMLSMFNLKKLFGAEWGWVRYPRGNTRVPDEILPAMLQIVRQELRRKRAACRRRGCVDGFIESGDRKVLCPACGGN